MLIRYQNERTNKQIRSKEWICRSSPSVAMVTGPGSFQSRVAGTCFRFPRFSFSLAPRAFFLPSEGGRSWLVARAASPTPPTARVRDLIASVSVVQRN